MKWTIEMPKWDPERIAITAVVCWSGMGLLLFWLIPYWRRQDKEKEEEKVGN